MQLGEKKLIVQRASVGAKNPSAQAMVGLIVLVHQQLWYICVTLYLPLEVECWGS